MIAPIFTWEVRRIVQQRWFHVVRFLYALAMLGLFLTCIADLQQFFQFTSVHRLRLLPSVRPYEFGGYLMRVHFWTIFAAAPVLVVGPFIRERTQRTLELLLTTHLRLSDIAVQHWLAAWSKLLVLTSPGIPLIFALNALLDTPWWLGLVWILGVWLAAMPFVAWSLVAAVLIGRTSAAMLVSYSGNAILAAAFAILIGTVQPVLEASTAQDLVFWLSLLLFFLGPTLLCLWIASCCLGKNHLVPPADAVEKKANRATLRIGDEPWYWKQSHLNDLHLPRLARAIPVWGRFGLLASLSCAMAWSIENTALVAGIGGIVILFGFPLAALACASLVITSEREANTWDSLRLAPIRADELVDQTVRAIAARTRIYWAAILPAVICVMVKRFDVGAPLLLLWLMAGGGVPHGAVFGLRISAQSRSSWQSVLMATIVFSFVGLFVTASCYVLALLLLVIFMKVSQDWHAVVALGLSLPITHLVFSLITTQLEHDTLRYLAKTELLYHNPLAPKPRDDSLLEWTGWTYENGRDVQS